jgi:hypothetical protein
VCDIKESQNVSERDVTAMSFGSNLLSRRAGLQFASEAINGSL